MSITQWQTSFEIGIRELDDQHKEFVALVNRIETSTHGRYSEIVAQEALRDLVHWAVTHFACEEQLMAENEYPSVDYHANLHQDFLSLLAKYLKKLKNEGGFSVTDFLSAMKSWLIGHIMREDSKLRRYAPTIGQLTSNQ